MHRKSRTPAFFYFFIFHTQYLSGASIPHTLHSAQAHSLFLCFLFSSVRFFFISIFLSKIYWRMTLLRFLFFYMHLFYQFNIIFELTTSRILDFKISAGPLLLLGAIRKATEADIAILVRRTNIVIDFAARTRIDKQIAGIAIQIARIEAARA